MSNSGASWRSLVRRYLSVIVQFFWRSLRFVTTAVLAVGLLTTTVVATTAGCGGAITAQELKAENPHLIHIDMCRRTPDIPDDVSVWVLDEKTRTITTEAYQRAYEEGRWEDLTAAEMEKYAFELHAAVEFMMRNRETAANVRDALSKPIDAVGTAAEFVLSTALWSHIGKSPNPRALIPVMRKPPAPVASKLTVFTGKIPSTTSTIPRVNAPSLGSDKALPPRGPTQPQQHPSGQTNSRPTNPTVH